MTIYVDIPTSYTPEREYIVRAMLESFLGQSIQIINQCESNEYVIHAGGKTIRIQDHFFTPMGQQEGNWASRAKVPEHAVFVNNSFVPETDMPIVYGDEALRIEENSILLGQDIFASAFFFLSRWEEVASKTRDEHERFPAEASFAHRNKILHRPIVEEYAHYLANLFRHIGVGVEVTPPGFRLELSHDIDWLWYQRFSIKTYLADIVKRRSLNTFFQRLKNRISNPYLQADYLMGQSEKAGTKSLFFIKTGTRHKHDFYDYLHSREFMTELSGIQERGHGIGLHASYLSYIDQELMVKEKDSLEAITGKKVTDSRQHYLRFSVPQTWELLDKAGFEKDHTMGYASHTGFRCGTSRSFRVFDCTKRKALGISEQPFVIMDGAIKRENNSISAKTIFDNYIRTCRKYKIPLALLFHNSSFENVLWYRWKRMYEWMIEQA